MPINYYIAENTLTVPTSYKGRVNETSSLNLDGIIREMIRQGSTVTKADIQAVLTDLISMIQNFLLMGSRVNIEGLVQFYPTMEGVFSDTNDSFDPARHKINVSSKTAPQLQDYVRNNATTEKEIAQPLMPVISQILDVWTSTIDTTVTPAQNISISGERLKFDSSRADEGIFFVNDTTTTTTQVPTGAIASATNKKLIFNSSAIGTTGDLCHFEVKTRLGNSTTYPLRVVTSVSLTMG